MSQGKLYIVGGPIGNLKDITHRALETISNSDIVLSEDTRETQKLFSYYHIQKPQISYRDQNHNRVVNIVEGYLKEGKNLCLLSDSGTPTISDPGYKLVHYLKYRNFELITVPGPSAIVSAISVSGLPTDRFVFLGFLPKSTSQRHNLLKTYGNLENTLIIYESPYRIHKLLSEILETLGDRLVCTARELTKSHEEVLTDKVTNLISKYKSNTPKGEFVVLVSKSD